MASPTINPSPAAGPTQQGGPAAGTSAGGGAADMAAFARISMRANEAAEQFPEAAQEMRQVQTLVRQATMKAIQQRSAAPPNQQTPQI